jgi:TolB-like protein
VGFLFPAGCKKTCTTGSISPSRISGEQQLKNIARPVRVYRVRLNGTAADRALALPDKPSIAVLAFNNISGDPDQEYFADGIVEEIITALSRMRWLFVIARNSSFTYKGRAVDVKQVGRELGVRYVLEGSVRKAANRVRITAQLIDALNGTHLWAERFEGALDDIYDLQDQVTASVVGAIAPKLQQAEIERVEHKRTERLDAGLRNVSYLSIWPSATRRLSTKSSTATRKTPVLPSRRLARGSSGFQRMVRAPGLGLVSDSSSIRFPKRSQTLALKERAFCGTSMTTSSPPAETMAG